MWQYKIVSYFIRYKLVFYILRYIFGKRQKKNFYLSCVSMRKTVLPRAKIMRFSGKKTDKLKKENVNVTKKVIN